MAYNVKSADYQNVFSRVSEGDEPAVATARRIAKETGLTPRYLRDAITEGRGISFSAYRVICTKMLGFDPGNLDEYRG